MSLAVSRRRLEHLEALAAVAAIEMAAAAANISDHLDERGKDGLTDEERSADRRMFLRELAKEHRRRGNLQPLAEALEELGDDSAAQIAADEALLDRWAQRNGVDVVRVRAHRVSRIQTHLRMVGVINEILVKLPRAEHDRVYADLVDGGSRSPLTERVRQVAQEHAAATKDEGDTWPSSSVDQAR